MADIIEVRIPQDFWETDGEGVIVTWIYGNGATVPKDAVLCEVMVEKAQMELSAPVAGSLEIVAPADQIVRKGDLVARIAPALAG